MLKSTKLNILEGDRYGRLTVLGEEEPLVTIHRIRRFSLRCDCGNEMISTLKDVRSGKTSSCGCKRQESHPIAPHFTHRMSKSIAYTSWCAMKARCLNPNLKIYPRYGGAGITVCERWIKFEHFLQDMGPRPSMKHSLDRYPNKAGNYEPGNCRWATKTEQSRNVRSNILIELNGESLTAMEWAEKLNIPWTTIMQRFKRSLPPDLILSTTQLRGTTKTPCVPHTPRSVDQNLGYKSW